MMSAHIVVVRLRSLGQPGIDGERLATSGLAFVIEQPKEQP